MSSRSTALNVDPANPTQSNPQKSFANLEALLGKPPLLESDDPAQYHALGQEIEEAVQPKDAIEKFSTRDLTDLTWEILRLRRQRDHLMRSSRRKGLRALLEPLVKASELSGLCQAWAKRDPEAVERVDEVLRQAGIDKEAIDAHTLRAELSMLQQIENLIAHGEARRHIILRELDRRRDMSETRSRSAPTRIEDAKFKELGPPKRSR